MNPDIESLYEIYLQHHKITIDSRKVESGSLFFALKGENFDGNKFAEDALKKGAAFAITDDETLPESDRIIKVEDVVKTLQKLAIFHRDQLMVPVIGITGSNGKTTTKELINAVLKKKYRTFATVGNLNNHIGVPLSVLSIQSHHEMAVIEMGANHQGEIGALSNMCKPDFGIITNIGKAHLEGFGGYEGVIKAKTELYRYIRESGGKLFVNAADPLLLEKSKGVKSIYYGNDDRATVAGEIIEKFPFIKMRMLIHNEQIVIKTNMVGAYNLDNTLAAACIGNHFGVSPNQIREAIEKYHPQNHRSQWYETKKNKIVMDAYNANPTSMLLALEHFAESPFKNKMLILGDMLELGAESQEEHLNIIRKIGELKLEDVLLVGPEFSRASKGEAGFSVFPDVEEAIDGLRKINPADKTILIKGSRGIQLEKTLEVL